MNNPFGANEPLPWYARRILHREKDFNGFAQIRRFFRPFVPCFNNQMRGKKEKGGELLFFQSERNLNSVYWSFRTFAHFLRLNHA